MPVRMRLPKMSRYIIYALSDPRTKIVRYIGMSTSGMSRPKQHAAESHLKRDEKHNWQKCAWIRELLGLGLMYGIHVLRELEEPHKGANLEERKPFALALGIAEREAIAMAKVSGCLLLNRTNGGDRYPGSSSWNKGKKLTDQHRARLRAAWLHREKTQSIETREKRSASLRASHAKNPRPALSLATREKIASTLRGNEPWNKGKVATEQHRARLVEAWQRRKANAL